LDKKRNAEAQADLKQIIMEVDILVKVQSKFIANLHGGFCDKDSVYLILDLLLAGSLDSQLTIMGDQTESNARFYISNIFAALEHLHFHRVIHRDLKPDNIVMCNNGYLKLIDFGASYMGNEKNKTCSFRSGTIPYMAPEIFCKSPRHNHTVDFYAAGVILFQILYKRVPYERGLKQAAPFIEKAKSDKSAEIPPGYAVKFEELAASNEIPSEECQNMVHRLMEIRPWARLGSEGGVKEIFEHSFYKDYDFQSIMNQTVVAPYIPDIQGGAINSQHEDCLDLFGRDDEAAPLTPEQEAIYFELADTLSKFNNSVSNSQL
jgi:serine/threonine protein kinase